MVPGDDILMSVYGKIINGHLEHFGGKDFHDLGERIIKSLLSFYN